MSDKRIPMPHAVGVCSRCDGTGRVDVRMFYDGKEHVATDQYCGNCSGHGGTLTEDERKKSIDLMNFIDSMDRSLAPHRFLQALAIIRELRQRPATTEQRSRP
jgi:hypothetical protein